MSEPDEARLVAEHVNTRPSGATEADEGQILAELYGPPGGDGIYRGGPDDEEGGL